MKVLAGQFGRWSVAMATALSFVSAAAGQLIPKQEDPEFQGVELVSKLGETVPLDLNLVNGEGQTVKLGQYFRPGKPVVLALVYFRCPMTCPLVLDKLQQGINGLPYLVGEDYNCVVVSFDPTEKPAAAMEQKNLYLGGYNKPVTPVAKAGWDFLVSPDSAARTLAASVGFQYKFIPETGQYSHPAALVVLTPEGKVARYVSGLDYTSQDLRLALLDASEGKIAKSIGDFFLHKCYRFDASTGKYSVQAFRVMQIGGILTALGVATLIAGLRASERLKAMRRKAREVSVIAPGPVGPLMGQAR